jgi:uncharacterized DUF497 family protein
MPSWDEAKRLRNIKSHGLDFVGAEAIWDNFTVTREDLRQDYGESRWKYEARYYLEIAQDQLR